MKRLYAVSMADCSYFDIAKQEALDAIKALQSGRAQSYTLPNGVTVTRMDLGKLMDTVKFWDDQLRACQGSSIYRPVLRTGV